MGTKVDKSPDKVIPGLVKPAPPKDLPSDNMEGVVDKNVALDNEKVEKIHKECCRLLDDSSREYSKWVDPRGRKEWTEEVVDQLEDGEVINGLPTTKGLRRFIHTFARILVSESRLEYSTANPGLKPNESLRGCICRHTLTIKLPNGDVQTFGAIADAFPDNLGLDDDRFRKYPSAMADTRAEGRALIRALALNKITSDELCHGDDVKIKIEAEKEELKEASMIQWDKLDKGFRDLNLNAKAVFNAFAKESGIKSVKSMNKRQAKFFMRKINDIRQSQPIDENLLGYEASWINNVRK